MDDPSWTRKTDRIPAIMAGAQGRNGVDGSRTRTQRGAICSTRGSAFAEDTIRPKTKHAARQEQPWRTKAAARPEPRALGFKADKFVTLRVDQPQLCILVKDGLHVCG